MIKVMEQGAYMNRVDRTEKGKIKATCTFLSTRYECDIVIYADLYEMKIDKTEYSIHRTPSNKEIIESEIPELVGVPCTFDAAKIIKTLPNYDGNGIIKELLLENIRGISQAECYYLEEMNFADPIEYEIYWQRDKTDYCIPYTGRMPELREWPDHINAFNHMRQKNLYNKYKQYTVYSTGGDEATIHGAYHDSFHEMHAYLTYSVTSREISDFDVTMCRWPFDACFALDHWNPGLFIGRNIDELSKREVGKLIGGSYGCFHLVDIVSDMSKAAKELTAAGSK